MRLKRRKRGVKVREPHQQLQREGQVKPDPFGGYLPDPPLDCAFPHTVVTGSDGRRWQDCVICSYYCENQHKCLAYKNFYRRNK